MLFTGCSRWVDQCYCPSHSGIHRIQYLKIVASSCSPWFYESTIYEPDRLICRRECTETSNALRMPLVVRNKSAQFLGDSSAYFWSINAQVACLSHWMMSEKKKKVAWYLKTEALHQDSKAGSARDLSKALLNGRVYSASGLDRYATAPRTE